MEISDKLLPSDRVLAVTGGADLRKGNYAWRATRWHALHRQCRNPCFGPWVRSRGKSSSGFHLRQVEQTFPSTPFLVIIALQFPGNRSVFLTISISCSFPSSSTT